MLAERAVTIAQDLLGEIERTGLVSLLEQATRLSGERPSISVSDYRKRARDLKSAANNIIESSKFNNYPHEFSKLLAASEFHVALPQSVARVILGGFPDHAAGAISSAELNMIMQEVHRLIANLNSFLAFSHSLKISGMEIPKDGTSLDVLIPRIIFRNDISDFANKLLVFDKLISSLIEYAIGERQKPQLQYISTSDPITTMIVAGGAISAILAFYTAILTAAEKTISVFKAIRELKNSGLDAENVEKVSATMKDAIENAVRTEVDRALARIVFKAEKGRANELRNQIRIEAIPATNYVANGARIFLSVEVDERLMVAPSDSTDDNSMADMIAAQKAIESRLDAITDGYREHIMLPLEQDREI